MRAEQATTSRKKEKSPSTTKQRGARCQLEQHRPKLKDDGENEARVGRNLKDLEYEALRTERRAGWQGDLQ